MYVLIDLAFMLLTCIGVPMNPARAEIARVNALEPRIEQKKIDVADKEVQLLLEAETWGVIVIRADSSWPKLDKAVKKRMAVLCLARLRSVRPTPLRETSDLNIPTRVQAGKMQLVFPGCTVWQDLFYENGRCAYAIEQLIGIRLPDFVEGMTKEQLDAAVDLSYKRVFEKMELP